MKLDDEGTQSMGNFRDMCQHRWTTKIKQSTETGYKQTMVIISPEGLETTDCVRYGVGTLQSFHFTSTMLQESRWDGASSARRLWSYL